MFTILLTRLESRGIMHSSEFINEMKTQLLASQKQLTEDLNGLSSHSEIGDDEDENASEIAVDEVNQDLIARIEKDLEKIEAALERISNGTYGVDLNTGEDISEDRLRALPWAETGI